MVVNNNYRKVTFVVDYFSIFQTVILVSINILAFFISYLVFKSSKKDKLGIWFGIMSFFMVAWVDFSYLGSIIDSSDLSLNFYKLNGVAVLGFIFSFYYFFVDKFLKWRSRSLPEPRRNR